MSQFCVQLMDLLDSENYNDIVSWLPTGDGFIIHDKKRFAEEVLPLYFKQSQYSSFVRRMSRWKFALVREGHKKAKFFHPLFVRGSNRTISCIRPSRQKRHGGYHDMEDDFLPVDEFQRKSQRAMNIPHHAFHKSSDLPMSQPHQQQLSQMEPLTTTMAGFGPPMMAIGNQDFMFNNPMTSDYNMQMQRMMMNQTNMMQHMQQRKHDFESGYLMAKKDAAKELEEEYLRNTKNFPPDRMSFSPSSMNPMVSSPPMMSNNQMMMMMNSMGMSASPSNHGGRMNPMPPDPQMQMFKMQQQMNKMPSNQSINPLQMMNSMSSMNMNRNMNSNMIHPPMGMNSPQQARMMNNLGVGMVPSVGTNMNYMMMSNYSALPMQRTSVMNQSFPSDYINGNGTNPMPRKMGYDPMTVERAGGMPRSSLSSITTRPTLVGGGGHTVSENSVNPDEAELNSHIISDAEKNLNMTSPSSEKEKKGNADNYYSSPKSESDESVPI